MEERWIFGDGEGMEPSEYIIHLHRPAFIAEIVTVEPDEETDGEDVEAGIDFEFVRWFDDEPKDPEVLARLVEEAYAALQHHDADMERMMAMQDEE